jgi:hypothetical protein
MESVKRISKTTDHRVLFDVLHELNAVVSRVVDVCSAVKTKSVVAKSKISESELKIWRR